LKDRLVTIQVDVLHADRFHALEEEHGRKPAPRDLVDDVLLGVLDADLIEPVGKIPIAEIPAL
jgi:hypothetical protein